MATTDAPIKMPIPGPGMPMGPVDGGPSTTVAGTLASPPTIKTALLGLLASKKAWALGLGVATLIAGRAGFDLDKDLCWQIFGLVSAYIIGQGVADHGKEAAKVAAAPSMQVKS